MWRSRRSSSIRARIAAKSSAARGRVLAAQLVHTCADRRDIIGSSRPGHVSRPMFLRDKRSCYFAAAGTLLVCGV
jgi:hypothetical protein